MYIHYTFRVSNQTLRRRPNAEAGNVIKAEALNIDEQEERKKEERKKKTLRVSLYIMNERKGKCQMGEG
jgi:hypothetical protein